jgi:hypothetical protein
MESELAQARDILRRIANLLFYQSEAPARGLAPVVSNKEFPGDVLDRMRAFFLEAGYGPKKD